jgi:hypothetical protein
METRKGVHEGVLNQQPVFLEESWAEAIRSRTGIVVHGEKSRMDVVHGEGADEGGSLGGGERSGLNRVSKGNGVGGGKRGTQEIFVEGMKDRCFGRVRENGSPIRVLQGFDLVFPKAAGGAEMEVMRVLIA